MTKYFLIKQVDGKNCDVISPMDVPELRCRCRLKVRNKICAVCRLFESGEDHLSSLSNKMTAGNWMECVL